MSRLDGPDRIAGAVTKSSLLVREPVILANLVSALLLEVCILLRQFGVPLTDGQVDAINAVAGLLLLIAAALFGRTLTTPLADPRNNLGQPLTPDQPVHAPADEVASGAAGAAAGAANDGAAPPLDAPPLPTDEAEIAQQLPTTPPGTRKGDGEGSIGGHHRKL